MVAVAKKNANFSKSHAVVAPPGEDMTACPEATVEAPAAATKNAPLDGRLTGTFGVEIVEESEVRLNDLRLTGTPQVTFGDPRVVSALSGDETCHASRSTNILLELPFDLTMSGNVEIDLEAFTKVIARARTARIDENSFTGPSAPTPPAPSTGSPF